MTPQEGLAFVERHGVVLQSARGPVPSLAEAVAGEPIRGSWWGHPAGQAIFRVASAVCDSPDVVVCRLVGGKVTYVHRRVWPALVRLAARLPAKDLAALHEEHTASGAHRMHRLSFPSWVPREVRAAAKRLSEEEALAQLGSWVSAALSPCAASARPPRRRARAPRRRTRRPS